MAILPSPASSPATGSLDEASQPSRKRQRSISMQSDASSSSVKRTVADGNTHDGAIRSPRADQMSTLTLTDPNHDIDSYMAEQGEDDILLISQAPSPLPESTPLALEEKLTIVEKGKGQSMVVGETWYLISRDWWKRWRKACTGEVDKEGPLSEQDLGPVDNSRLLDAHSKLQLDLAEGVDVEYVPEDVWKLFVDWLVYHRALMVW